MNEKSIEERNALFDSSVREQIAGYEPAVPHALWHRIASELDNGEASDISPIAAHHEQSTFGKWRLAMAAVVILTLTVGALLYTLNPKGESALTSAPVAHNSIKNTTASQPTIAPIQVAKTKVVAQTIVTRKAVKAYPTPNVNSSTANIAKTTEPTPTIAKQEQSNQEDELALAPILTQNTPVDVGNIPLSALNVRILPSAVNDEITVIRPIENKKKKHGRKNEEPAKVIVIEKKYDSRPDISYQLPVKF